MSAWPPSLKEFVARALKASIPSTKNQVNDELKKIIFDAHKSGTLQTTKWEEMDPVVVISTLQLQQHRSTPTLSPLPPSGAFNGAVNGNANGNGLPGAFGGGKKRKGGGGADDDGSGVALGNGKRKKNAASASSSFPSAYTFAANPSAEDEAKLRRLRRFEAEKAAAASGPVGPVFVPRGVAAAAVGGKKKWLGSRLGLADLPVADPNVIDWDKHTIVGTNQRLEKRYLRLTSEPDPADVRPLPVLQQTLELLKNKWKTEHNYGYICDQFKSLRQDLTVQRIKNEFTIRVYEIHARMALEAKDLGEYNQCQSMLQQLYERDIPGGHPGEFLAYRILYLLHTRNKADLARLLSQLDIDQKSEPAVRHALAVQTALATGNYHKFFRLFEDTSKDEMQTNMGGYIMDHFIERERVVALGVMAKGYMTLPLTFISQDLAFESLSHADKFLADHSAAIYVAPTPAQSATATASLLGARARKHPPAIPLENRVWDCRAAAAAVEKGMERYKTVDLKGQIA